MRENQYDFDQQHPKLVVYDQNGWHQDHCHADGEYYGKFGTFNVTISLPCNCIVCTTGVPGEGDPGWFWIEFDTSLSDQER